MKTCFKCQRCLPRDQFYRHAAMGDGLLGKCKDCTKADIARRAVVKREELLAYDRQRAMLPHRVAGRKEYSQTEQGRRAHAKALRRSGERYPEKRHARITFGNAVRDGKIVRKPCEVCGDHKSEGHHPDYSKPLEVRWLCNKHHRDQHRPIFTNAQIHMPF